MPCWPAAPRQRLNRRRLLGCTVSSAPQLQLQLALRHFLDKVPDGYTTDDEIKRLRTLGFGKQQQRAAVNRTANTSATRKRKATSGDEGDDESNDESSNNDDDEDESNDDNDELNEILVKWKGYSTKDNSWEPDENILQRKLIHEYMQRRSKSNTTTRAEVGATVESRNAKQTRSGGRGRR